MHRKIEHPFLMHVLRLCMIHFYTFKCLHPKIILSSKCITVKFRLKTLGNYKFLEFFSQKQLIVFAPTRKSSNNAPGILTETHETQFSGSI